MNIGKHGLKMKIEIIILKAIGIISEMVGSRITQEGSMGTQEDWNYHRSTWKQLHGELED